MMDAMITPDEHISSPQSDDSDILLPSWVNEYAPKRDVNSAQIDSRQLEARTGLNERDKTTIIIVSLGALAVAAALLAHNALDGGSENPTKFGEIDHGITEVTINPGANINHDPFVSDADNNNLVTTAHHELVIETPEGAYLRENTNNGDWAGLTLAQIQEADPTFVSDGDKDNVFWVNLNNDAASAERQADD